MIDSNRSNKGIGIALIVIGGFFLISQFIDFSIGAVFWPFFILVPGLILLAAAFIASKSFAGLAIPGSIVTTVGALLFFQNITGRFETWAYLWTLIPIAVGIGLFIQGNLIAGEALRHQGRRTIIIGLIMLVVFGAFFELLIFNNFVNSFAWRYVVPVALIGGGGYLLMRQQQVKDLPPSPPT